MKLAADVDQNQQKKKAEANSREYQERKRLEEREKGFNVHFQGANKDLGTR